MLMSNYRKLMLALVTTLVMVLGFGCQNSDIATNSTEPSDMELVQSIQDSPDRQAVEVDALPSSISSTLAEEYSESVVLDAVYVPESGYEVTLMRCEGSLIGERNQVYFDRNGRDLENGNGQYNDRLNHHGGNLRECFDFVYPITLIMADGTEITGTTREELHELVLAWHEANPDVVGRPALQFPVDITFVEDGTVMTINSQEELIAARELCLPTGGGHQGGGNPGGPGGLLGGPCFDFVYPITLIMPDETTITGTSAVELHELVLAWHEANPDLVGRPALQYPVDIVYDDETVATITSEEELIAAREACEPEGGHHGGGNTGPGGLLGGPCFDFVFPITLIMTDESTITGNSADELHALVLAWHEANPDLVGRPALQFPLDIMYEDGSVVTLTSQEELIAAREACDPMGGGGGNGGHGGEGGGGNTGPGGLLAGPCFDFVFPITLIMPDESTITGNSADELHALVLAWHEANPDLVGRPALQFPLDIVYEDGSVVTLTSQEELIAAREACDPMGGGNGGEGGGGPGRP